LSIDGADVIGPWSGGPLTVIVIMAVIVTLLVAAYAVSQATKDRSHRAMVRRDRPGLRQEGRLREPGSAARPGWDHPKKTRSIRRIPTGPQRVERSLPNVVKIVVVILFIMFCIRLFEGAASQREFHGEDVWSNLERSFESFVDGSDNDRTARPSRPESPLVLTAQPVERVTEDGRDVLVIHGAIRNTGSEPWDLPDLRLDLRTAMGAPIQDLLRPPPVSALAPGERSTFTVRVDDWPPATASVDVGFGDPDAGGPPVVLNLNGQGSSGLISKPTAR